MTIVALQHLALLWSAFGLARLGVASLGAFSISLALSCALFTNDRFRRLARLPGGMLALLLAADMVRRPPYGAPDHALVSFAAVAFAVLISIQPWRSRPATWLARALLTATACLTTLSVATLFLRNWAPQNLHDIEPLPESAARELVVHGSRPKWTFARNFVGVFLHPQYNRERMETNSDGFRDLPWPERPDAETLGVLVLGDSMTVGLGVERQESYAALLERELAATSPRPVRCYNGGVSGYGPGEQLIIAQQYLERLAPRLVVALFYDGNDLDDVRQQFFMERQREKSAIRLPSESRPSDVSRPALGGSTGRPRGVFDIEYWRRAKAIGFLMERCEQLLIRYGWIDLQRIAGDWLLRSMHAHPDLEIVETEQLAVAAFVTLKREVEARGGRLLVARVPSRFQVSQQMLARSLAMLGITDLSPYDRAQPGGAMLELLLKARVPTIDLLPLMEQEADPGECFFAEGHLSRHGHRVIAKALTERIGPTLAAEPSPVAPGTGASDSR